jgi:hypothetical protein
MIFPWGRSAQEEYLRLLDAVEQRWRARFGPAAIDTLRRSLLSVTGQRDNGRPRLALGLRPTPMGGGRGPYLRQTTPCSTTPAPRCPATRWCCTVAGGPTAADTPGAGGAAGPGWAAPGRAGLRRAGRGKMEP